MMQLTADQALNHVWFQGDLKVCSMAMKIMFNSEDITMPQAVAQDDQKRQLRLRLRLGLSLPMCEMNSLSSLSYNVIPFP